MYIMYSYCVLVSVSVSCSAVNGNSGADGILVAMDALGGLFSCISSTSLHTMFRLGIRATSLHYTSPWLPTQDLIQARTRGVDVVSVETEKQARKMAIHHKQAQLVIHIAAPNHQVRHDTHTHRHTYIYVHTRVFHVSIMMI